MDNKPKSKYTNLELSDVSVDGLISGEINAWDLLCRAADKQVYDMSTLLESGPLDTQSLDAAFRYRFQQELDSADHQRQMREIYTIRKN